MRTRVPSGRLAAVLVAGAALLPSGSGLAAPTAAPTAITGPVSSVGPTSATANGTVNPNGQSTTWYVEYGTSTAYGTKTSSKSAGAGASNTAVSASLTGLAPGTTYHYRVVATNGAGTARGADGIFATPSAPGAVTGSASAVTMSSAVLSGTVDPNGRATTWYFEYGTSTSYGSKTPAKGAGSGSTSIGVSAPVSSLSRGRLYHFRIVAASDAGTARGADRTFSTAGAPNAVTGSATSITLRSARLNGTVNPNGLATTWFFEYGTTTGYGSQTSLGVAGSGTMSRNVAVSLSGLKPGTTYHYRLIAANASGASVGADRVFRSAGRPVARTGVVRDIGSATATPSGSVNPQGRRTSWYFEYGPTARLGWRTPARSAGSGFRDQDASAPISSLRTATTYYYRLVAKNDAGTSRGATLRFTTAGVTLTARAFRVVFGRRVMLVGVVPTRRAGEQVTLSAQEFGDASPRPIAVVVTGDGGVWRYLARPTIRTGYRASWDGGTSPELMIGVRPAVRFRAIANRRFATRVVAERTFAGRRVQLQRRTASGRWVTLKHVRLNRRSAAVFRAALPRGTSRIRVAMSINQAGAGYLGGISRTLLRRRG
jgi:Fibronectin type III domain